MDVEYQRQEPRWVHRIVVLVVLVTCLRVWIGPMTLVEPACAQVANPASQRTQLLTETRRTNQLLEEIKQLLKTHTLNVRVEGADNQAVVPAPNRKDR